MADTEDPTGDTSTCARAHCRESTSEELAAIQINGNSVCSPDCARAYLSARDAAPDSITLHDPQFAVARDEVPDVSADQVSMVRRVADRADARAAIDEIETMFPTEFRPY